MQILKDRLSRMALLVLASVLLVQGQTDTSTGIPTISPTLSPTVSSPTTSPSISPTNSEPSSSPTEAPTTFPTSNPTSSRPTVSPTISPTVSPSSSPTTSPTNSPATSNPTNIPTISPTLSPTFSSPTTSPSSSPTTANPSSSPTSSPTITPTTSEPSSSPTTANPSVSPTTSPTESPTSSLPSTAPTANPSISPSTSGPTNSPTTSPTLNPTESPTTSAPSAIPTTSFPSHSPTISPTSSPITSNPTTTPSTSAPTNAPSTSSPTSNPSSNAPTNSPSRSPTGNPSSSRPTFAPSASPTREPSSVPTQSPTTRILFQPTGTFTCPENRRTITNAVECENIANGAPFTDNTAEDAICVFDYSDQSYSFSAVYGSNDGAVCLPASFKLTYWLQFSDLSSCEAQKFNNLKTGVITGLQASANPLLRANVVIVDSLSTCQSPVDPCDGATSHVLQSFNASITPIQQQVCAASPTLSPTSTAPTGDPTVSPTSSPSVSPSIRPTFSAPTVSPTESASPITTLPTVPPTTSNPTTALPTSPPTTNPTKSPTSDPTSNPTEGPVPSVSPTVNPSKSPTSNPTEGPVPSTARPSVSPSSSPSTGPTLSPSRLPTTVSPTVNPSKSPTSSPTRPGGGRRKRQTQCNIATQYEYTYDADGTTESACGDWTSGTAVIVLELDVDVSTNPADVVAALNDYLEEYSNNQSTGWRAEMACTDCGLLVAPVGAMHGLQPAYLEDNPMPGYAFISAKIDTQTVDGMRSPDNVTVFWNHVIDAVGNGVVDPNTNTMGSVLFTGSPANTIEFRISVPAAKADGANSALTQFLANGTSVRLALGLTGSDSIPTIEQIVIYHTVCEPCQTARYLDEPIDQYYPKQCRYNLFGECATCTVCAANEYIHDTCGQLDDTDCRASLAPTFAPSRSPSIQPSTTAPTSLSNSPTFTPTTSVPTRSPTSSQPTATPTRSPVSISVRLVPGISAIDETTTSIKIRWDVAQNTIAQLAGRASDFLILYRVVQSNSSFATQQTGSFNVPYQSNQQDYNVTGLVPHVAYEFAVVIEENGIDIPTNIHNDIIDSDWSAPIYTVEDTPNGPPTNIERNDVTSTGATLVWDAPSPINRRGSITGYEVEYQLTDGTLTCGARIQGQRELELVSGTTIALGLKPNAHYAVTVRAGTSTGYGVASPLVCVSTYARIMSSTNPVLNVLSQNQPGLLQDVTVSWPNQTVLRGDQVGFAPLTEIVVLWKMVSDPDQSNDYAATQYPNADKFGFSILDNVSSTSYLIEGLQPYIRYHFYVVAVSPLNSVEVPARGASESEIQAFVDASQTKQTEQLSTVRTAPAAPTGPVRSLVIQSDRSDATFITLRFRLPFNSQRHGNLTTFNVTRVYTAPDSPFKDPEKADSETISFNVNNYRVEDNRYFINMTQLDEAVEYNFTVYPINNQVPEAGPGVSVLGTTDTAIPDSAPTTCISASALNGSKIDISWNEPLAHRQNGAIEEYRVDVYYTDNNSVAASVETEATSIFFDDLASNTSYTVNISARTDASSEDSTWSPELSCVVKTVIPAAAVEEAGGGGGGAAIIGAVVAILLLIVIGGLLYYRKKKGLSPFTEKAKQGKAPSNYESHQLNDYSRAQSGYGTAATSATTETSFDSSGQGSDRGLKIPAPPKLPPVQSHPIAVADLPRTIVQMSANSDFAFSEEYECLETGNEFSREAATLYENKMKNRYANILAYDYTRVRLSVLPGDQYSDYINANYINGHGAKGNRKYIAAQGPTALTVIDFWRMMFEQDVDSIMMVTNCEEKGRVKCQRYWPAGVNQEMPLLENFNVTLTKTEEFPDYIIRTMVMRLNGQARILRQYHYTSWPDHGVPETTAPIIQMLKKARSTHNVKRGPMVVHCSAGVGRTGTLIAIDHGIDQAEATDGVDIYACMNLMRRQRNTMVQTEEQYIFIHRALADSLASAASEMTQAELRSHYDQLHSISSTGVTVLDAEFKKLVESSNQLAQSFRTDGAQLQTNKAKNRFQNILPFEHTRVKLATLPGIIGSDYVNASFIDGHKRRGAYIATQGPLEDTLGDFWRLVWEQEVDVIIMLTELVEDERQKSVQYWPDQDEGRINIGDFQVMINQEKQTDYGVERTLTLMDLVSEGSRTIRHCQYLKWPGTHQQQNAMPMASMCAAIKSYQASKVILPQQENIYGNATAITEQAVVMQTKPLVVHCSAGVGRTGAFCAFHIALSRLLEEEKVDIFTIVKHLRTQRMSMVQTADQYEFIFKMVIDSLDFTPSMASPSPAPIPQSAPLYENYEPEQMSHGREISFSPEDRPPEQAPPPLPVKSIRTTQFLDEQPRERSGSIIMHEDESHFTV